MYTLYWNQGTASFAPQAVLYEAGLAHKLVTIDTPTGQHRTPEYLAINPVGKVPAMVLPDGQIMYESAAICLYLADQHGLDDLAPPAGHRQWAPFLRDLFYLSNTVQSTFKRFYYPQRFSTERSDIPNIKERALDELWENWALVEGNLAKEGPYHLGARYSLVDIYMVMLATWFPSMEDLLKKYDAVSRCYELTSKRPAIERCLKANVEFSVGQD
jgi:glutathione S-transferase